eukprot:Clim_evm30s204 gene=Clim_evmTU30s204
MSMSPEEQKVIGAAMQRLPEDVKGRVGKLFTTAMPELQFVLKEILIALAPHINNGAAAAPATGGTANAASQPADVKTEEEQAETKPAPSRQPKIVSRNCASQTDITLPDPLPSAATVTGVVMPTVANGSAVVSAAPVSKVGKVSKQISVSESKEDFTLLKNVGFTVPKRKGLDLVYHATDRCLRAMKDGTQAVAQIAVDNIALVAIVVDHVSPTKATWHAFIIEHPSPNFKRAKRGQQNVGEVLAIASPAVEGSEDCVVDSSGSGDAEDGDAPADGGKKQKEGRGAKRAAASAAKTQRVPSNSAEFNAWLGNEHPEIATLVKHLKSLRPSGIPIMFARDSSFKSQRRVGGGYPFVMANVNMKEGPLYIMKDGLLFAKNPYLWIPYDDIANMGLENVNRHTFELHLTLKSGGPVEELCMISAEEVDVLAEHLKRNAGKATNWQETKQEDGDDDDDDDEDDEDEQDADFKEESEEESSSDEDSEDEGSGEPEDEEDEDGEEDLEDEEEDLEEEEEEASKPKKKPRHV